MRIVNRVLAISLALGLIAVCGAIIVESVAALFDQGPLLLPLERWDRWWADRRWDDDVLTIVLVCVGVAGVLLFLFESWRRRPDVVEIEPTGGARSGTRRIVLGRRGLENHVKMIIEREDGVLSASARAHRRKMSIDITTSATNKDISSLRDRVKATSKRELDGLALHRKLRVGVDVNRAKQRVR